MVLAVINSVKMRAHAMQQKCSSSLSRTPGDRGCRKGGPVLTSLPPAAQQQQQRIGRQSLRTMAIAAQPKASGSSVQASTSAPSTPGCRLMGVGSCVPETVLTNADMEAYVDTNDEWIASRTGIKQRHVLGKGETLVQLAVKASQRALEMAQVEASDIDLVLFATSTPDDAFGSACQVQAAIGAKRAIAFDLTAACSGFVVALVTGAQFIRTGTYRNVLVIGGDAMSRLVDWRDRGTCILFGDGCGALVLTSTASSSSNGTGSRAAGHLADSATTNSHASSSNGTSSSGGSSCGLLGMDMGSDGGGSKSLNCTFSGDGGKPQDATAASSRATYSNVYMNGQEVFKFAVRTVPTVIESALSKAGLATSDIDWLVMHQANQRILDAAATRLGLPPERVVSNLARYGNTSAGSIPLALDEAVRSGQIQPGQTIAMAGFGAGLTWASAIVRWR